MEKIDCRICDQCRLVIPYSIGCVKSENGYKHFCNRNCYMNYHNGVNDEEIEDEYSNS